MWLAEGAMPSLPAHPEQTFPVHTWVLLGAWGEAPSLRALQRSPAPAAEPDR